MYFLPQAKSVSLRSCQASFSPVSLSEKERTPRVSCVPSVPSCKPQQHCSCSARARAPLSGLSILLIIALGLLSAPGCARRAYTDVYVENMASEIRDLEDQLYEFDSEYRVLEQELETLHAENARLRNTLATRTAPNAAGSGSPDASPASPKNGSTQPRLLPVPGSGTPDASSPRSVPNPVPPPQNAAPVPATPSRPGPGDDGSDPYNLENLIPPTIDQGEAMPPSLPPPQNDPSVPVSSNGNSKLEIELGQIPLPAQLASASSAEDVDEAPSRLAPAAEMPEDTRVAEINFHPSLCRAVNLDDKGGDDGVYLVLQPLNEGREFVPLSADLLIVAIDPARDGAQARIGRWSLTAAEAEAKLQPIGSSQGIHLSLPWTGGNPEADRVIVFVRYTMTDGRQIIGEHTVLVNDARRANTVWVPRAKTNAAGSEVRTASGERPVR